MRENILTKVLLILSDLLLGSCVYPPVLPPSSSSSSLMGARLGNRTEGRQTLQRAHKHTGRCVRRFTLVPRPTWKAEKAGESGVRVQEQ